MWLLGCWQVAKPPAPNWTVAHGHIANWHPHFLSTSKQALISAMHFTWLSVIHILNIQPPGKLHVCPGIKNCSSYYSGYKATRALSGQSLNTQEALIFLVPGFTEHQECMYWVLAETSVVNVHALLSLFLQLDHVLRQQVGVITR